MSYVNRFQNSESKRILIITAFIGYVCRGLLANLRGDGFEVETIPPNTNLIAQKIDEGYTYLLLETSTRIPDDVLVYLRDSQFDKEYNLFVMYSDVNEQARIQRYISDDFVYRTYSTPINIRDIIYDVKKLQDKDIIVRKKKILLFDMAITALRTQSLWLKGLYITKTVNTELQAFNELCNFHPDLVMMSTSLPILSLEDFFKIIEADSSLKKTRFGFYDKDTEFRKAYVSTKFPPFCCISKMANRGEYLNMIAGAFSRIGDEERYTDSRASMFLRKSV